MRRDAGVTISAAGERDLPVLLGLWRALEEAQAPYRLMPVVPDAPARIEAVFREALRDPDATVLLATRGRDTLGMVVLRLEAQRGRSLSDGATVELSRMVVAPSARGEGIGRALVDAARLFARERGADWLSAKVVAGNLDARAFWGRAGFRVNYESWARPVD